MNLLSTIIDRLNQRIEAGNIFDQIYGLSELAADGNDKAWIHYIGNGQAIPVTNFDAKQGTLFWAKRGKISVSKIETFKLAGCKSMYETRYSLSANAVVRKSHLPCDSADAQDWIASRVLKLISGTDPQFKTAIGVVSYEVVPNGYTNEIKSLPANYEWASVTIDVDINVVSGSEDGCYDTCATGDIPLPDFEPCTPCLTEVAVDGVTITGNGTPADPLVAIGGGGGTPLTTQEEGSNVSTNTTTLNFTGAGVTASLTSPGVVEVNVPGGGGGGGTLLALPFSTDHLSATGNAYAINDVVYYLGNVYRCIASNDSILPTNTLYWTNIGAGFPLVQQPSDWNATSGNNQILNKPTIPATIVEDVTATAPIASSGGTTPDISISQADATTDGYLSSADWATFDGKQDTLTAGTGISITGVTIDNTAPDQIVSLTPGTGISTSGTYPNFTIDNTAPDQVVGLTAGTGISVSGTYPNFTIDNTAPSSGGTVTSVGTTGLISGGPITTSGTITTSMSTGKLVGRATAGSGIMEEITVGSGLTLTGAGVLNNTSTPTPTGYYGAFQDNTTQTAALANTAYAVKLNTTDLTNGVSVVNDGSGNPTRITLANTGIYNIQFSLQLEKTGGSGNFTVDVWVRKNGVDIPNTTGKVVLTGSANASPVVAAWNYVLDLAANDYVQLMWSTSNNNSIILAAVATPPHPGIPSAILTVTQQAGIMAGTGITAINSLTGAAQSLVVGTGGTDFAVSSLGTTHTFNLPVASATNTGKLSSTDWSTFNSKFNTPAGTTAQYIRGDGSLATLPSGGPVIYKSTTDGTSITGVASEQISASQLIPANTFAVGDIIRISWRTRKTGTASGSTFKLYINTTASLTGAIQLGLLSIAGSTNLTNQMQRNLAIKSATNTEAFSNVNVSDDFTFTSPAVISANVNWAVDQYIIFMTQITTATADTVRTSFYLIEKL